MSMAPLIIPIFLPNVGCRDRCLFCNQKASAEGLPSPSSVRNFIEASLAGIPYNKKSREKQVAFYGGSFTAIHRDDQVRYLEEVQPFLASGLIHSIRISTRPDALDEEVLSLLKEYGVKTVEIGTQSMIDEVLILANRGHWADDTISAVPRLREWGFEVGLQLMIGLPGDSFVRFFQTLDQVIDLKPDFVRIHPTLVLKGSPLEILWRTGRYSPLSLEETIQWLKRGLLKLERSSIPVARIGLQPTKEWERDFLAGPFHPALHQLVDSEIFFDMAISLLDLFNDELEQVFFCHATEISNMRGQRNGNIVRLREKFRLKEISVQGSGDVPRGSLALQTQKGNISIQRRELRYSDRRIEGWGHLLNYNTQESM
jgi:histone acetyltransferase (RNA polymerase elongator complex component)